MTQHYRQPWEDKDSNDGDHKLQSTYDGIHTLCGELITHLHTIAKIRIAKIPYKYEGLQFGLQVESVNAKRIKKVDTSYALNCSGTRFLSIEN